MKRFGFVLLTALMVLVTMGIVFWTNLRAAADLPSDYTGTPPFISSTVAPNILMVMDNSGSMTQRAACRAGQPCEPFAFSDAAGTTIPTFSGIFDSRRCYDYFPASNRYEISGPPKATIEAKCPATLWDGNFLNWITFRRFDAVKQALMGGDCDFDPLFALSGRDPNSLPPNDAICIPSGSPAKKTIRGQFDFTSTSGGHEFPVTACSVEVLVVDPVEVVIAGKRFFKVTAANGPMFGVPKTPPAKQDFFECVVPNQLIPKDPQDPKFRGNPIPKANKILKDGLLISYDGRIPTSVSNSEANLFFPLRGGKSGMQGSFCVDNDPGADVTKLKLGNTATSCSDDTFAPPQNDAFGETQFFVRAVVPNDSLGVAIEPKGVIQDLGDKARFGLMEFKDTGDGARVLTPIGLRQSINFSNAGLQTFATNKGAMIASIEKSIPKTNTPLAESLFEAVSYVAQINSAFAPGSYNYPLAFSPAVGLTANGAGSLGDGNGIAGSAKEITVLTGSETCPAGYLPGACGRDPFFFGSDHKPAWASPSTQVSCCKTFIMILTDGGPSSDQGVTNATLREFAADKSATIGFEKCTGKGSNVSATPTPNITPPTTCYDGTKTEGVVAPFTLSKSQEALLLLHQHKTDYLDAAGNPSGSHFLDDVALWGHTTDLRQATIPVIGAAGHDLPGVQNVTVYSFFAFGTIEGRELLMQTARQGGFDDLDKPGDAGFNLPDKQVEYDKLNNNTGAAGSDGFPDTFFESQNVQDLREKLLAAISSILQKAASGTSVSVLATSSTGEGAIYQAFFFPSILNTVGSITTDVKWTGYVQGLYVDTFGNLREDFSTDCHLNVKTTSPSLPDGILNLKHDCIIKIRFNTATNEVAVDRFSDDGSQGGIAGDGVADDINSDKFVSDGFTDTSGDGIINSVQSPCSTSGVGPSLCGSGPGSTPLDAPSDAVETNVKLKDIHPIWEGGRRLALTQPGANCPANAAGLGVTCRRILTWADFSNGGGVNVGPVGSFGLEYDEFTAARVVSFCPFLGGVAAIHCGDNTPGALVQTDIDGDATLKTSQSCVGLTRKQCAQQEATAIINFIRGCDPLDTLTECMNGAKSTVQGLRPRQLNVIPDGGGAAVQRTWKLGDVIHSTPVVEGPPRERYDVIYGDEGYARFFQRYKDRRQVAYVGANDGMLHAFNAGFFSLGDVIDTPSVKEQLRFTTVPQQPGRNLACTALPCDASVTQYSYRTNTPARGTELWAFIPQDLLPQLQYLTSGNYDHTYYVDLKPKVTDVRIFADDADHPGGWGTILIGGFRLGGGCANCEQGKSKARVVNSDFDDNGSTNDTCGANCGAGSGADVRVFLSSYFVMDVTNPEKDPVLLWTFRDKDLGLTTSAPAVVRVSPSKADIANEQWFVAFGSGPSHLDAENNSPKQSGKIFVVNLKTGPNFSTINQSSGTLGDGTVCSSASPCVVAGQNSSSRSFSTSELGFMGDGASLDFNLDFNVDVMYFGSVICNGAIPNSCNGSNPKWRGAMNRLTTCVSPSNCVNSTDSSLWGITSGSSRAPSKLISTFSCPQGVPDCTGAGGKFVGPVTSIPALTADDNNNIWVYFGTGRFYSNNDKSNPDVQHYFGVKDSYITQGSPAQTVERHNLFDSSLVVVCTKCDPASPGKVSVNGDTSAAGFSIGFDTGPNNLLNQLQNMDGWFTTLPNTRERNLSPGTLIGGTLFFTTFVPEPDICVAAGNGFLYAIYYQTGGAYKESAIGTTTAGSTTQVSKSISLGQGLPSQMAVQIGSKGTGASGTESGEGCSGRITGFIQASSGVLGQKCGSAAEQFLSRLLSWRDL